ncbi:TspO protein [Methanocella sp. CWC-04]|uniref:TspO protein n=1 Tax=Methanooceanicella nereidis TaxID=2052831 RepID=A0AAP2W4I0_9EURY|nr:TspO/MBR family protein [Methanocella sp. CWC-04]MCD1294300.1 TspO protein [Methanocella sp. CWC-04]
MISDRLKLVISLGICLLAGIIGGAITAPNIMTWYGTLIKPSFSPPNWLFGPVWTILYILMGVALFLIWKKINEAPEAKTAIAFFGIQLVLNFFWSLFFFGLHSISLAFLDIVLLLIFIILTTMKFYRIDKTAAYLMVPYLLWVSFATILNLSLLLLNP